MSTFKEIITRVDEIKPNAFLETTKLNWLTSLNGKLAIDIFLMDIAEVRELPHGADAIDKEPLIGFPHEEVYDEYLAAKIDAANGEAGEYQNRMQIYDAYYTNFVSWFKATYDPVQGDPNCHGLLPKQPTYYITAYGMAVMNGFRGTFEEWIVSLKGEPGVSPTVTIDTIEGGNRITFESAEGTKSFDVMNGTGAVSSVCGVLPDDTGDVPLTAEKIGARPNSWTPTAEDVGARPNSWTPTAEDVGARPNTWTPSAEDVKALPTEGGDMTGPINMNGQSLSGLNSPTKDNEATTKGYVDTAISDAIDNVKSVAKTATLAAGSWSNNAQTVVVEGVTEDNNIIVTGNPDCIEAWTNAGVYCSAQDANALTFTCTDVPTEELTANILILG